MPLRLSCAEVCSTLSLLHTLLAFNPPSFVFSGRRFDSLFHFPLSIPHWQDICLQSKQTLHIPQSCPPPKLMRWPSFLCHAKRRRPKRKLMSQLACYVLGEKNEKYWFYVYVPLRPNAGDDVRASFFLGGGCMACDKRECVPTTIWSNRASPIRTHRWGRKRTLWIKACNLPFVFVTRKAKPFLYTAINVLLTVLFSLLLDGGLCCESDE